MSVHATHVSAVARLPRASTPCIDDVAKWGVIAANTTSRSDLLRRFDRWTCSRKIKMCTGLSANIILAHELTKDEIDRWMEAYRKRDFEALKIGYGKKRRTAIKIASSFRSEHAGTVASG